MVAALPKEAVPCQELDCDLLMSFIQGGEVGKGRKNFHILYSGWTRLIRTLDWEEAVSLYRRSLAGYLALFANQHTLMDCFKVEIHGSPCMICPDPEDRQHVMNAFPQAQEWVDVEILSDCPRLVAVTTPGQQQAVEIVSPSQKAFEVVRFAGPTRVQPEKILALATRLSSEVQMYRVPVGWARREFESFCNSRNGPVYSGG